MNAIFDAYFSSVGYGFFQGVMALVILFEAGYTVFEAWDML